jgi:uncharacterized protein (DUF427 family)
MMKAIWNNKIIAESSDIVKVEGNCYFPAESVRNEFLRNSKTYTVCHWKGKASYYTLEVDGMQNPDAAWWYPEPSGLAQSIRGRVAFWKGVQIVKE